MTTPKVSVASLSNPTKSGFLTKQGGSIKTWKKRWFVLKGDTLWYFKTQKDQEATGFIKLEKDVSCQLLESKNKKNSFFFSVNTREREYIIFSETAQQAKEWVDCITSSLKDKKGGGSSVTTSSSPASSAPPPSTPISSNPVTSKPDESPMKSAASPPSNGGMDKPSGGGGGGGGGTQIISNNISPRHLINLAKGAVPFMNDDNSSKVAEFWQLWADSVPPSSELTAPDMNIEYHVAANASMQKLTWRTAGPQFVFIQRMVDFFWNVGAPEPEIDRLNDVGVVINPHRIGSWIDMSAKGGMDGGWFFPVSMTVDLALEGADPGASVDALRNWATKNQVQDCFYVGRDMGAAPPRQTEVRLILPGNTFEQQMAVAKDAYVCFNFPEPPKEAMDVLHEYKTPGLRLSVITSSEGFVRIGLLSPKPKNDAVVKLSNLTGANSEELGTFEGSLGTEGPDFVELQYLCQGFGYNVYNEGFDVVFHYFVGLETASDS